MPQEIAATLSRSTLALIMLRVFIQLRQSASATQPPVIAAVRVPPSACSTSQSTVICRSPSASRSTMARSERPISRWISTVRPPCLPAEASRRVRSSVARGSLPYSAVTQPRPWPFSQGGSRSSSVAVTSTWVSPNFTRQDPSAYLTTPRSSETARSSSGARRLGRMGGLQEVDDRWRKGRLAELVGGGTEGGKGRQGVVRPLTLLFDPAMPACQGPGGRTNYRRYQGVLGGPSRSDRSYCATLRSGPAQRAVAGHLPPDCGELSGDRGTRRLPKHLPADRGSAFARLGTQCHGRSRAARTDLCAPHLGRPASDRARPAF